MVEQWNFIGPLTKAQALTLGTPVAREQLLNFVPERCQGCKYLESDVIGGIVTRLVMNEVSLIDGAKELFMFTADCASAEDGSSRQDASAICSGGQEEKSFWR
jgi:hypothetical protein